MLTISVMRSLYRLLLSQEVEGSALRVDRLVRRGGRGGEARRQVRGGGGGGQPRRKVRRGGQPTGQLHGGGGPAVRGGAGGGRHILVR